LNPFPSFIPRVLSKEEDNAEGKGAELGTTGEERGLAEVPGCIPVPGIAIGDLTKNIFKKKMFDLFFFLFLRSF